WARDHSLLAARAVTVAFGAVSLASLFGAARRLYDRESALVASLLYLFCPYALFYDRLALTDPVQSAFATLALLLSVRAVEDGRWRDGLALGLALALSVFAKALGALAFLTPALAFALLRRGRSAARAVVLAYAVAGTLVAYPLWRFLSTTA